MFNVCFSYGFYFCDKDHNNQKQFGGILFYFILHLQVTVHHRESRAGNWRQESKQRVLLTCLLLTLAQPAFLHIQGEFYTGVAPTKMGWTLTHQLLLKTLSYRLAQGWPFFLPNWLKLLSNWHKTSETLMNIASGTYITKQMS